MDRKSLAYSLLLLLSLAIVSVLVSRNVVQAILDPAHLTLSTSAAPNPLNLPREFSASLLFPNEEATLGGVQLQIDQVADESGPIASTTRVLAFLPTDYATATTVVTDPVTVPAGSGFASGTISTRHIFTSVQVFDDTLGTLPLPGVTLPSGSTFTGFGGGKFKGTSASSELTYLSIKWLAPQETAFIGDYEAKLLVHVGGFGDYLDILSSNTVGFSIAAAEVDKPPVATDDPDTTDEDTPKLVDVLANDNDPDADPLTVSAVTQPTEGAVTIAGDGSSVTFDPTGSAVLQALRTGQNSVQTFDYDVTDGVFTDTGTVTMTVTGSNDPPVGNDDSYNVTAGDVLDIGALTLSVFDNDFDAEDGQNLTAPTSTDVPVGEGTLTFNAADGTFTYDPGNFVGNTSFTYTPRDQDGLDGNVTLVELLQGPAFEMVVETALPVDEDSSVITIRINLINATPLNSSVRLQTQDTGAGVGFAAAGADYTAVDQTVTLNDQTSSTTINITILNDAAATARRYEGLEAFEATLSNQTTTGTTTATSIKAPATVALTIDDPQDLPALSIDSVSVDEPAGVATLTVTQAGLSVLTTTARYDTQNDLTVAAGRRATANYDLFVKTPRQPGARWG